MTEDQVLAFLGDLPGLPRPKGPAVPLTGGLMNRVWRVPGDPTSVIVKFAPPYVAAAPSIPVDPSRLGYEARALELLAARAAAWPVRAPRLLYHDPGRSVLVMEDLGDLPDLARLLATGAAGRARGAHLGGFLGELHATTRDLVGHHNAPVQVTRKAVQYDAVAGLSGVDPEAARAARDLGRRLLEPGRCLVMGDLWPPSVLGAVAGDELFLIDWEFSHKGQPAQDLGHLLAHLWMLEDRGPAALRARVAGFREGFLDGYLEGLGQAGDLLLDEGTRRDTAVHMGCEVLARTRGAFREGFLYAGCPLEGDAVRGAVANAVGWMLRGDEWSRRLCRRALRRTGTPRP